MKITTVTLALCLAVSAARAQTYLPLSGGTMTGALAINAGSISMTGSTPSSLNIYGNASVDYLLGDISAGVFIRTGAGTINNTASSGTINGTFAVNNFSRVTLTANTATTYQNAATIYVGNTPLQDPSGTVTITNPYSIFSANGDVGVINGQLQLGGTNPGIPTVPSLHGAELLANSAQINDTTVYGSGSNNVANNMVNSFGASTLNATSCTTPCTGVVYGAAATVYIAGAPTNGTSATITNPYALDVNTGLSRFNGGITATGGSVSMPTLTSSSAAQTGTVCFGSGGVLTYDTTTTCLLSSVRWKQDVTDLDAGLAEIMRLRPVSYELKPEVNPAHLGRQVGLVAEDVQKVDDRLVGVGSDGAANGVRYQQLTAVLVKAIQEQQIEIDQLRGELERLKKHPSIASANGAPDPG